MTLLRPRRQKTRTYTAIDIGSSAVKIVRAELARGTPPRVLGVALESLADQTSAAITTALQRAATTAGVTDKTVRISMAGPDVMTRYITLPTMTPEELDGAIRFEGESYIPFPLAEVILDKQILETLGSGKIRILLVAGRREAIDRRLAVVREAGWQPTVLDVDALALVNAYLGDHAATPPAQTTALIQIGARYTNVAILQRGQSCAFTRDLTVAGADFTNTMAERLSVSPAEADQLRQQPGEREAEVTAALRSGIELLASELRLSFDYYDSQYEGGVERVVLTGGCSLAPLVPPLVQELLGTPVEVWAPQRWLSTAGKPVPKEQAARLAVCVGLLAREGA